MKAWLSGGSSLAAAAREEDVVEDEASEWVDEARDGAAEPLRNLSRDIGGSGGMGMSGVSGWLDGRRACAGSACDGSACDGSLCVSLAAGVSTFGAAEISSLAGSASAAGLTVAGVIDPDTGGSDAAVPRVGVVDIAGIGAPVSGAADFSAGSAIVFAGVSGDAARACLGGTVAAGFASTASMSSTWP